jgi:predicted DNA-binding mobile mystery protein A
MRRAKLTARSRAHLDARFKALGPATRFTPPVRGWIKAIRDSLGISTVQLARRLRVKQPSVIDLERSEAKATIEMATLRRVAAALDCTLVYALVPNQPLETIVRDRARSFARRRLAPVQHSMLLENQKVPSKTRYSQAQLDEIIRETNPRLFWD